jgi:hypothetical protein
VLHHHERDRQMTEAEREKLLSDGQPRSLEVGRVARAAAHDLRLVL